jgi:hypothetical protein
MTKKEQHLFEYACYWYVRYKRSNPEVGFGPSPESIVKYVAEENNIIPIPVLTPEFRAKLTRILY